MSCPVSVNRLQCLGMEKFAQMEASWKKLLEPEFSKPYMKELEKFLAQEYGSGKTVFPPFESIFEVFCQCPFDKTRVVIIGQDPYHGEGQAHGLSFSVRKGVASPPSLQNIFKELLADLGVKIPSHGYLIDWAKQGVFLLNATLTVLEGEPKSHFGRGWEQFTDRVVELLAEKRERLVFLLWGKSAADKLQHIETKDQMKRHLVLKSPHPSPFSAHSGFFGCRHFSKANEFLKAAGDPEIDWEL
jgi:uracil-DNA glycosylase